MTQLNNKEKIELLKSTIIQMYTIEGYPKARIARILQIDRRILTTYINDIWKLRPAGFTKISKSKEKWLNRHRLEIKAKLDRSESIKSIAKFYQMSDRNIVTNYFKKDKILEQAYNEYTHRIHQNAQNNRNTRKNKLTRNYTISPLPNEQWKPILGYPNYYVSNKGRIKRYTKTYNTYYLILQASNIRNKRLYIKIGEKGLQVSRIVGFAFVKGHSDEKNTIDHIDGNVQNNDAKNLRWVSQSINNKAAYQNGRKSNIAYSKHPKFKKIIIDNTYEFKTIRAFAKFYEVSESQAQRYLNHECKFNHKIKFYY